MLALMTSDYKKKLFFYYVSIHRNFYQNRFINECARKKKAKMLEFQRFFVGYRRTYLFFVLQIKNYFALKHQSNLTINKN